MDPSDEKEKAISAWDKQSWHWGEGNKYVVEGGKALLLINGGAIVSILTFIGNRQIRHVSLQFPVFSFGFGALCAVVLFAVSYEAQLQYGNGSGWWANFWHYVAYGAAVLSIVAFAAGGYVAADRLSKAINAAPDTACPQGK